tara:strand:+ start:68371 stop:69345 length:975 start_codon:yes stop_codon:yes gene_type:complete
MNNLRFIDLFAGIGGFRLGLESLGMECVYTSEWNKRAQEVYKMNFNETPDGDITKVKESDIPPHDILCGGFPCQAFSVAGKRLGFNDTRGTLFFDVARIVKYHRPSVVFLENVKNFLGHDSGRTMQTVKATLEDLGYNVTFKVLRSSDYGVPQARERVFIIGVYGSNENFIFPEAIRAQKVVDDILLDLSQKEFKELQIKRDDMYFYKDEKAVLNLRSPHQIGKINKGGQGERIYSRFAAGITLSAYGGGAAAKTGAYKVGRRVRKLHPVECLRMQGFPDNFKLGPSIVNTYQQLGNSVSVPVIKAVGKEILNQVFIGEELKAS